MDTENFDRLVSSMSLEERQNLLKKMKSEFTVSTEFLYIQDDPVSSGMDAQKAGYEKLPWYTRFWYYLLSIFKSVPPDKIYAEDQVSILGNKINERAPGIYNYQKGLLLPAFLVQMEKLREAGRFFYSALDASVNRDRGAFFSFLGSLEMMDVHRVLHEETDPQNIAAKNPNIEDAELRQISMKAIDAALKMITDEQRVIMYQNARSLFCLRELSTFLYDRLIMAFSKNSANEEACSVNSVRELLITLSNILFSLKTVPPMPLLESLFVFILQDKSKEPEFDINKEILSLMQKAQAALAIIRDFNNQVPLTYILRCSTKNMSFLPIEVSGGEDWFMFYRDHWKKRFESLFVEYLKNKRQQHFIEIFNYYFKGKELKTLKYTQSDFGPEGLSVKGAMALSFLYTFYSAVFVPDIDKVLKPIFDGEAYRFFIGLEDEIMKFEHNISPSGDYGKRYIQVQKEMTAQSVKNRKLQHVLDEIQEDAGKIIDGAMEAAQRIVEKIKDAPEKGSPGKDLSQINEITLHFQGLITILKDIEEMESGS